MVVGKSKEYCKAKIKNLQDTKKQGLKGVSKDLLVPGVALQRAITAANVYKSKEVEVKTVRTNISDLEADLEQRGKKWQKLRKTVATITNSKFDETLNAKGEGGCGRGCGAGPHSLGSPPLPRPALPHTLPPVRLPAFSAPGRLRPRPPAPPPARAPAHPRPHPPAPSPPPPPGHSGQVTFDHKERTLSVIVQKDNRDSQSQITDPKLLSGGERSYVTLSLLISLGECIECPFRVVSRRARPPQFPTCCAHAPPRTTRSHHSLRRLTCSRRPVHASTSHARRLSPRVSRGVLPHPPSLFLVPLLRWTNLTCSWMRCRAKGRSRR